MRPLRDVRAAGAPVQIRLAWRVATRPSVAAVLIHSGPSVSIRCVRLASSTLPEVVVVVRAASDPKVAADVVRAVAVVRWDRWAAVVV